MVVVLAQDEARSLRHSYIGTEHLLLGLLREEDRPRLPHPRGAGRHARRGARARRTHRRRGRGDSWADRSLFTPRAKKVLELSLREALTLGHNYIGTEHLLLGLVRENDGVALAHPARVRR